MAKRKTVFALFEQMRDEGIYPETVEVINARNNEVRGQESFWFVPFIVLDRFVVSYDLSEDNKYLKIVSSIT